MKNKTGMKNLRNQIVLRFVIVVFVVRVVDSAIDSMWDEVIAPALYPGGDYTGIVDAGTLGYMSASFVLYILSAVIFYFMVKKIVARESRKQLQEQNLIYAAIAHDLKTPMTSVQGFAKALADGKIKPEEMGEICDIIYTKSKSMDALVNTLFDYAKCGTGGYRMILEKTDLCVLLRDIVAEHYCDLELHDIVPDIDISETPVFVDADRGELKRALSNLIVNTYKHNPDGIRMQITLQADDRRATLVIADNGNPIPGDLRIFDPFVTENTARTTGKGTGLGLAITKHILDEHGAKIRICDHIPGFVKGFVIEFSVANINQ